MSPKARVFLVFFVGILMLAGLTVVQFQKHRMPASETEMEGEHSSWPKGMMRVSALFSRRPLAPRQLAGLHEYPPPLAPEQCRCPGEGQTAAGSWNRCLSCLYVSFMDLHNGVAREFSPLLDPSDDFDGTAEVGGQSLRVVARPSLLAGYERQLQLSRQEGGVCLNLHVTRDAKRPERLKALLQLDSETCPSDGIAGSHAVAMKLDLGMTDPTRETAELFHAGEYEGNGFNVTGTDSDDLFYMRVETGPSNGKRVTTSWAYRATQNRGWKYFLNGEDDVLLYIATKPELPLSDAARSQAGLLVQCVDDRLDKSMALNECEKRGFRFAEFPLSLQSITGTAYPHWTTNSATLQKELQLFEYFKPELK